MLAAILFDLDGTLVNSDSWHFLTWQEVLKEFGISIRANASNFYKEDTQRV
jgi:beta-phosphoglucomutase-like phosphatase (HAD superfamily)